MGNYEGQTHSTGPDWIHNNLQKSLPEDTEEFQKDPEKHLDLWQFPESVESSNCDPIPKPNKVHSDPFSFRPVVLTSCLCKILKHVINT